ncbi:palmitoyltransferase ZDHHC16A isoform X3 [Coregonus clupeaformis]|uniref:palmitoyltransferase ZDHHC16A isoform X3 n=1 Tax=Coregonus clupeaformis TaxID=59861 RepID=UPI001BE0886E|nr:palmitoyltransferase ZDHHC16A isoform X3 [Coregonus clupeaformis]
MFHRSLLYPLSYRSRMRPCPTFPLMRWLWLCVCTRQWHCSNSNGNNCRLPLCVRQIWAYLRLMVDSLYYNSLTNSDVVMDSLLEPIIWMVDLLTRRLGAMKNDSPFVSVCKKCVIPKPARTHHCAICNTCILKMDHHCPWLNNCVGHFNQRYFFSFCVAMTLGCIYCSISGRNLFLDACSAVQSPYQTPPFTFRDEMFHKSIIYMWVLTSMVAVSLGGLTIWHAVLISRGETSIERHLNNKETKRMRKHGKVYKNPFNYGRLNNWKVFLGVAKKSHWLTRVLLPSGHVPFGNSLTWDIYPIRKDMMPI